MTISTDIDYTRIASLPTCGGFGCAQRLEDLAPPVTDDIDTFELALEAMRREATKARRQQLRATLDRAATKLLDLACDGNHAGPPCADPECWHMKGALPRGGLVDLVNRVVTVNMPRECKRCGWKLADEVTGYVGACPRCAMVTANSVFTQREMVSLESMKRS